MYKILSKIDSPKDLKKLDIETLDRLSIELRDFLLKSVSNTGGHLASNLGTVELTISLHYIFDSPKDKLIWDVGHQAYTHKILTGRKDQFNTLRKKDGLSGFIKRKESKHDIFEAGHSSTSISAAIGMAKARDIDNDNYNILPIIGDGAMTSGMAYEALNYLGHSNENITVIFNDNEMSIDNNVGALSKCLSTLRSSKTYRGIKKDLKNTLQKIPKVGNSFQESLGKIKKSVKNFLVPEMIFEDLGFKYLGPVDGHNISELNNILKKSKKFDEPVLIHVKTVKGKGYMPAQNSPRDYHGVGKFELKKGKKSKKTVKYSHVFGNTLLNLAKKNKDIFAITAAMPKGTGLLDFKEKLNNQYIDVGIAEQNATTLAAGLAINNKKPFVAIYSTFLQRAYDQVLHDVCLQNLPVVFCLDRAGIVGKDGSTHHGVFDLSYLISIPNLMVMAPKDGYELKRMINFSSNYKKGPVAIRYPRGKAIDINKSKTNILDFEVLKDGKKIAILAVGKMVKTALEVSKEFDEYDIKVINLRVVKPINFEKLKNSLENIDTILTIEDNVKIGAVGSYINQNLGNKYKIFNIGYNDNFIEHGDTKELIKENGLDKDSILEFIKNI
ncbi:MAG: 1-deoxy-D-xylulose-5-phosphate synthase [Bacillota bacterium]